MKQLTILMLAVLPLAACVPYAAESPSSTAGTDLQPPKIALTGCVASHFFAPHAGTKVVARSIAGDIVASGASDAKGAFTIQVPASKKVVISVDQRDGDAMIVEVGTASMYTDGCLRDFAA